MFSPQSIGEKPSLTHGNYTFHRSDHPGYTTLVFDIFRHSVFLGKIIFFPNAGSCLVLFKNKTLLQKYRLAIQTNLSSQGFDPCYFGVYKKDDKPIQDKAIVKQDKKASDGGLIFSLCVVGALIFFCLGGLIGILLK